MNKKEQIEEMAKGRQEYLKFKPFADDLRKAESWCELDGVLNRYQTVKNLSKMGYRKQEWISVDERLLDDIDDYIVVVKMKYEWETEWEYDTDVAAFVFENGYIDNHWDTFNDWYEGQECHVTHWMPLPEAPKMRKEDEGR